MTTSKRVSFTFKTCVREHRLSKFAEQISLEFPEVKMPVFGKGSPRIVAYKELTTTSLQ